MNQARKYVQLLYSEVLRSASDAVRSRYRQVLDAGQEFDRVDLEASRKLHDRGRCQPGECYKNCQMALCSNPELRYFEGWVMSGIPIEHAWLVDGDSESVIEPTLVDLASWLDGPEKEYFGVEIPATFVRERLVKSMVAQPLLWRFVNETVKEVL